jgi:hypothetical protein
MVTGSVIVGRFEAGFMDLSALGSTLLRMLKFMGSTQQPVDPVEETVSISNSGLKYDASTGQYIYSWKTDKGWASTCRQLVIKPKDESEHPINFKFK